MAEQRAVCAAVPVRALLQLPLLGVNRGYKGLYGGGWPLRGMGAAGTALGAADARTNEHYEIGTILTQKSQGVRPPHEGSMSADSRRPRAGAPERRQKATCSKALSNAAVKRDRRTLNFGGAEIHTRL